MLQNLKITSCAFILCLFGLPLMTGSPVFAEDSAARYSACDDIRNPNGMDKATMSLKMMCFRSLAKELMGGNKSVEGTVDGGGKQKSDPFAECVERGIKSSPWAGTSSAGDILAETRANRECKKDPTAFGGSK